MSGNAFETLIRERLRDVKHEVVAQAIGRDRTLIGKWLEGSAGLRLEQLTALVDHLGIDLMDGGQIAIEMSEYERLLEAQAELASLKLKLLRERR